MNNQNILIYIPIVNGIITFLHFILNKNVVKTTDIISATKNQK